MRTAFVIFDGMTVLDFVGVYDALTRLRRPELVPGFEWSVCAMEEEVTGDRGLHLCADTVGEPLHDYDMLVVPGGTGTRSLRRDIAFIKWLRTASEVPMKASVCTGSLLLGAAGYLEGLRATTHPTAMDDLRPYCAEVVEDRVVDEGNVVTSRGVTAGIDLGLHLVERIAGGDARDFIAGRMDYPYRYTP